MAAGFPLNKQPKAEREPKMEASDFHNLILKVIYRHLCCILLVTRLTLEQCRRGLSKGVNTRGQGLLGTILEAGYHITYAPA